MNAPLQDFGRVLRALFRFARGASYGLIGLMAVFLAIRVVEAHAFFADIHWALGVLFLLVSFVLLGWLVGRPLYRFWRVPVAMRPPVLPPMAGRRARHLVRHLDFVERYVRALLENPEWSGAPSEVEAIVTRCRALRAEAAAAGPAEVVALSARVRDLETGGVGRLLEPLDRKARQVIRQEALRVGIATAVSWNGTMDAFLVLWRNCNLVSRIAGIYYGRPGPRGTLGILRDVSAAAIASAYLQDLSEAAGGALGSVFGKTVGALGGPVLDGGMNAVATLRIGYVAKARCRAFSGWSEATRGEAVVDAVKEAATFSKEVVTEVVKAVGGGLLRLPGKALGKVGDLLGGLWTRATGGPGEPNPSEA